MHLLIAEGGIMGDVDYRSMHDAIFHSLYELDLDIFRFFDNVVFVLSAGKRRTYIPASITLLDKSVLISLGRETMRSVISSIADMATSLYCSMLLIREDPEILIRIASRNESFGIAARPEIAKLLWWVSDLTGIGRDKSNIMSIGIARAISMFVPTGLSGPRVDRRDPSIILNVRNALLSSDFVGLDVVLTLGNDESGGLDYKLKTFPSSIFRSIKSSRQYSEYIKVLKKFDTRFRSKGDAVILPSFIITVDPPGIASSYRSYTETRMEMFERSQREEIYMVKILKGHPLFEKGRIMFNWTESIGGNVAPAVTTLNNLFFPVK